MTRDSRPNRTAVTVFVCTVFVCTATQTALAALPATESVLAEDESSTRKYDGKTIDEWVAMLGQGFGPSQEANRALAKIGKPAMPALIEALKSRKPDFGRVLQALGKMGPAARDAVPLLIDLAKDRNLAEPEKWTWNTSPRHMVFSSLQQMGWAAAQLVPLLSRVAADDTETEDARVRAARALGGMGKKGVPALRKLVDSDSDELRRTTHYALVEALGLDRKEYFAQVLEEDPFDPNASDYLGRAKGIVNAGKLHPLTEKVKTALRERLREDPDPKIATALLTIIQNQLASTAIQWAVPADGISSRWDRENPKESFHTLEPIAEVGFNHAAKDSEDRRKFAVGLAKLHLLRGDWAGMNRWLRKLGQKPISSKLRAQLAAPPMDWSKDLATTWKRCDESMRSGNSSLVLRIQKGGKGLAGAHVLVKEAPKPQKVFTSGIAADTLFLSPYPFEIFLGSFGYRTADRERTRYAVSGPSGIVRFNKLPAIAVKIEVLVPTGNFAEAGPNWELWMDVGNGEFKRASGFPGGDGVGPSSPIARVALEEGKTFQYPPLVVRPRFGFNIHDWARVDKDSFELTWTRPATDTGDLTYELEMALSALTQHPDFVQSTPSLLSAKETVNDTSWPIGKKGVGGVRLRPGNFYVLELTARDGADQAVARWPKTRIWVPWEHRQTDDPLLTGRGGRDGVPAFHGMWWRQGSTYGDGTKENLRQMTARFLKQRPKAFEYEYVEMVDAWLDWRDGKADRTRKKLTKLKGKVPEGSVLRATVDWLLEQLDTGKKCPKRLNFVGE